METHFVSNTIPITSMIIYKIVYYHILTSLKYNPWHINIIILNDSIVKFKISTVGNILIL